MSRLSFRIEDRESPFTRQEAEQVADNEIKEFNDWYTNHFREQAPLTRFERAILKSYLVYAMDGTMNS